MSGKLPTLAVGALGLAFGLGASACWDIDRAAEAWCEDNAGRPELIVGAACEDDSDCCGDGFRCESGACAAAPGMAEDGGLDGGATDGGDPDGGGPPTLGTFCAQVGTLWAQSLEGCGNSDPGARAALAALLTGYRCKGADASVAAGFRLFDAELATDCLQELPAAFERCDAQQLPWVCEQALSPAADRGQSCLNALDCVLPGDDCAGSGCDRTCVPKGSIEGAACTAHGTCAPELFCDQGRVCRVPREPGASCNGSQDECRGGYCNSSDVCAAYPVVGSPCAPNTVHPRCAEDAFCDSSEMCVARAPQGQACNASPECEAGLRCVSGSCQPRAALNELCDDDSDCQEELTCDSGKCQPRFGLDSSCERDAQCEPALTCDPVVRACLEVRYEQPEHAPCTGGHQVCASGLVCAGVDPVLRLAGHCRVPVLGASCEAHEECPVGGTCVDKQCVEAPPGARCTTSQNCRPDEFCAPSDGGDGTCTPRAGKDAPCDVGLKQCEQTLFCTATSAGTTTGVCRERLSAGDACTDDPTTPPCKFQHFCQEGFCTLAGAQGTPCVYGTFCMEGKCEQGVCTAPLADGNVCSHVTPLECEGECVEDSCLTCN